MDITFTCESCGLQIAVEASRAGRLISCPNCEGSITVPGNPGEKRRPDGTLPRLSGSARDTKQCPFCAETIKREAIVCKHCGREIGAGISSREAGSQAGATLNSFYDAPSNRRANSLRLIISICVAIALGLFAYLAYRAYQDSFDYKTTDFTAAPEYGIYSVAPPSVEIGYVTPDGWQVFRITKTPGGYSITYRRKKQ